MIIPRTSVFVVVPVSQEGEVTEPVKPSLDVQLGVLGCVGHQMES